MTELLGSDDGGERLWCKDWRFLFEGDKSGRWGGCYCGRRRYWLRHVEFYLLQRLLLLVSWQVEEVVVEDLVLLSCAVKSERIRS